MAVFTEVSFDEAAAFVHTLGLGTLQDMQACAGGIENTNYFVTTDAGDYVLTLFERLGFAQLPFYLHLMKHLAAKGIPVPDPAASASGELVQRLNGKPAAVVNRLKGRSDLAPGKAHCADVGAMLARMHLAGADFSMHQPNLRGLAWWNETAQLVLPHLEPGQRQLLLGELAYQNHLAALSVTSALPRGPIHADLFRDNVMFDGETLTGFFDFYFAGWDALVLDLAVCLNDWCIDLPTGAHDEARACAFIAGYESVRPLVASERTLLPAMLRAGALRFWISRLWDWHLPRGAALLQPHDPSHFERVLRARVQTPLTLIA
jgi:homoserine kinase type II